MDERPQCFNDDIPSTIILPADCSRLPKDVLIDRIKGCIYGQAIGDAVGLFTEFMSVKEAQKTYKNKPLRFNTRVENSHNSRWQSGDWTDDTDQMILILEAMLANGGCITPKDFALRLDYWVKRGYPELGDRRGMGLGSTTNQVVSSNEFLENPHQAAKHIFDHSNGMAAANGAVMRTSILGIPWLYDISKTKENTAAIAQTTHYDPRCVASCVVMTTTIALILQGVYDMSSTKDLSTISKLAVDTGKQYAANFGDELEKYCNSKTFTQLGLGDYSTGIGYTFKCIGAGMVGFRKVKHDFEHIITKLTMQAGDADTNGAVCGALVGCRLGYNRLPPFWLNEMPNKKWLDERVDRLLAMLGLAT